MPTDPIPREQLAWLMRAHGTTRLELARVTGRTRQLVSRWLNGTRGISDRDLLAIADHYRIGVAFLRYGSAGVDLPVLSQITAGTLEGLRDEGVLATSASASAIAELVAWAYGHYAAHGRPPSPDELRPLIRILAEHGGPGRQKSG